MRLQLWLDIAIIIFVSAVGMAILSRHPGGALSQCTSVTPSMSDARAAAPPILITAGGAQKKYTVVRGYEIRPIPSELRINGVFLGMSSKDLEDHLGSAPYKSEPIYGEQVWCYRDLTARLAQYSSDLPRIFEMRGTELIRGGEVLLQVGDSRADVFQAFPDATPVVAEGSPQWDASEKIEVIDISPSPHFPQPGMIPEDWFILCIVLVDGQINNIQANLRHCRSR